MVTVINKQSGKVLFASANFEDTNTEIGINEILTEYFVMPYFNQTTREFYEGATQEEIDQYNASIVPVEVPLWAMRNVLKKRNLFETIIGAINQLDEPLKSDALDFLEYGNFIERYSNAVLLIQQITQMSNDESDDLFVEANNIKL